MGNQWAGTTYGSGWMHKCLICFLRYVDVRVLYVFSYIFIIPVVLAVGGSRGCSYRYFRRRHGYGRLKSVWQTYANHCRFAEVVIDKFAMYAGRRFKVEIIGRDLFDSLDAGPDGFVMMSSHIGNYEIAGYCIESRKKSINALVYDREKESIMANRGMMFSRTNVSMIPLKDDMSHLFEINAALDGGNVVSIPADRVTGPRVIRRNFLGAPASFPQGPFSVAAMRGLNVLAVNVMKSGWTGYTIYVVPLDYDTTASRGEQIEQLSGAYVAELERRLRQYPAQWYNFYEFWQ